jgi:hypothetical protein
MFRPERLVSSQLLVTPAVQRRRQQLLGRSKQRYATD